MSNTPQHGSDVQETPEWWKASDGRFYPPELHPNYVKPAEAAPPVAPPAAAAAPESSRPSLSERMRADAAGGARDTLGAAKSTAESAAGGVAGAVGGVAGAAGAAVSGAMPGAMPDDPRATMPATPTQAEPSMTETVIQRAADPLGAPAAAPSTPSMPPATPPTIPPSPGTPPSMPAMPAPGAAPSMPPSPGAPPAMPAPGTPPGMPPAPTSPPVIPSGLQDTAPATMQGADAQAAMATMPGGVPQPGMPGMPGMPAQPAPVAASTGKIASSTAGAVALLAGIAAVAGSLLQWGKGSVVGANGAEKAIIEVAGFDSNGLITAICGGVLILCGLLFFMGVPKQLNWAILAFLGGAVIVGSVVFSMIDIGDLSNRYAAQWQNEGLASVGDVISTQADLGLWIAGAGGVLGVLAAPFVNRG